MRRQKISNFSYKIDNKKLILKIIPNFAAGAMFATGFKCKQTCKKIRSTSYFYYPANSCLTFKIQQSKTQNINKKFYAFNMVKVRI